jgi:CheY-like chemotaxis protein
MPSSRKIIAIVTDLMFITKIQDGARRAGFTTQFAKSAAEAVEKAKEAPAVIILDLNAAGSNAEETISFLKSAPETKDIKLLGFVSHVASDVIRAAQQAGCDRVVARSAFSQNLPELLEGYQPQQH